ncbi:MAG: molybdate ABC transporter substrate-binding protein [Tepidisphaeraceae bacterium]
MRWRGSFAIALVLLISGGCRKEQPAAVSAPPATVNVLAAASLTESFTEIGKRFEAENPGVRIEFNFAGSQALRAQLENGAPADVFASANAKEMNTAWTEFLVKPGTIRDFACNRLVVIVPKGNPGKIATLNDLGNRGVKIDVADASVPAGQYTLQMLDRMSGNRAYGPEFKKDFLANVVSQEENVKSVVSKIRLGEADAGVVYVTDVSADAAKDVQTLSVPDSLNPIASYSIAVVAKAPQARLAEKFEDFVLSDEGQGILHDFNFIPASPGMR